MRILTLTVALVFAAAIGMASAQTKGTKTAAGKTHLVKAEIVSTDAAAKTITIKNAQGDTQTVPVMGKAVSQLASLKSGEAVTLTCQDNAKGEHQSITAIKVAPAAKAKK